eukprot:m.63475 g.63475  ORF g.63475 m.63475 type:complete len:50 (+) comp8070_c1_seq1:1442-1591(+)
MQSAETTIEGLKQWMCVCELQSMRNEKNKKIKMRAMRSKDPIFIILSVG